MISYNMHSLLSLSLTLSLSLYIYLYKYTPTFLHSRFSIVYDLVP